MKIAFVRLFWWQFAALMISGLVLMPALTFGQELPVATPVDPATLLAGEANPLGALATVVDWAQLKDTLWFRHGALNALLAWMAVSRAVFKLVNGKLETFAQSFIAFWVRQKDEEAIARIERFLSSRPYRLLAFLADYCLSWKLPLNVNRETVETLRLGKP